MAKCTIWIMIAVMTSFMACDVTDSGSQDTEYLNTLTGEEVLFSKNVGPHDTGQGEFYPLAVGNTWTYSGSRSMGVEGSSPFDYTVEETRTITGMEELFGREYFIEEQVSSFTSAVGPNVVTYWYRYRQDRAGLYEADVSITDPPSNDLEAAGGSQWDELWQRSITDLESIDSEAVARMKIAHFRKIEAVNELLGRRTGNTMLTGRPGGILPDEIQRLEYPLHVRQEWIIRETPLFSSTVERMEVLDLPAGRMNGWKISVYSEFLDENDTIYIWYSRSGFLAQEIHLETETTLIDGTVETMISDETLYLESYDLEGNGNKEDCTEDGKKAESGKSDLTLN